MKNSYIVANYVNLVRSKRLSPENALAVSMYEHFQGGLIIKAPVTHTSKILSAISVKGRA